MLGSCSQWYNKEIWEWQTTKQVLSILIQQKFFSVNVTSAVAISEWAHDDGKGDPWWTGSSNPKAYRWEITMTVTNVNHGSHLTRTPRVFNGYDVLVGDFIAGATDGRSLQIISISEKTAFTVTCVVEDRLRYNTFCSASGSGIFTVPGAGVIFQINENGDQMLDPVFQRYCISRLLCKRKLKI